MTGPTHLRNIRFRAIRPDDWHRLQRFHSRLSDTTIELRFHGAKRELSAPMAHRFTDLDGVNDVAIVATTGTRGRIVGVARYCRMSTDTAELAFVIEDTYQHAGVGRRLMQRLRQTAEENGITRFVASVLPGNNAMLHLLQDAGETKVRFDGGVWEVVTELNAS